MSMSQAVYNIINKANMAMEMKMYDEAIKLSQDVLKRKGLNAYEQVTAYQLIAYSQYYLGQTKTALENFEKIIKIGDGVKGLPDGLVDGVKYNLATMYIQEGQYDRGIKMLKNWLAAATNPAPDAYVLIGTAYAQKEDYKAAIPYFEKAIDVAKSQDKEPQQNWYQNLASMYLQLQQFKKAEPILELMVSKWPTRDYLMNLAQVYGMDKREKDMLGIIDVMYRKGLLKTGNEIIQLSQLWQIHDGPYRGAEILKKGIDDGKVEKTAKNYEGLANAYIAAAELPKAIPYLEKAASLSKDGAIYVRLGEAYVGDQKWEKADTALNNAFKKGGLKNTNQAHYLQGIALYNMDKLNDAKRAFALCRDDKGLGKSCGQYLVVIRNKEKRKNG
jgi:tetratricopeptide (TPR) repeat protein